MNGTDLRSWRQRRGLTRRALALILGTTETTIYRWETGRRQIRNATLVEAALRDYEQQQARA
jgi:transcriptional regulator with XRE-family HTH domain